MTRSCWCAAFALGIGLSSQIVVTAKEPLPSDKALTLHESRPWITYPTGQFGYALYRGQFCAGFAPGHTPAPAVKSNDYSVTYPDLKPGDVIPIFGTVYRVAFAGRPIRLKWVKESDLPKEARFEDDSYLVPVGGSGQLRGLPFLFKEIKTVETDGKTVHRAVIDRYPKSYGRGDDFEIGDHLYRVRNVVPPDKKSGIIGWLELAPVPVPAKKKPAAGTSDAL